MGHQTRPGPRPGIPGGYGGRPRPGAMRYPVRPQFPRGGFNYRRPMGRPFFRPPGQQDSICRIVRQILIANPQLAGPIQEALMRHGINCPGLPMGGGGMGGRGRRRHGRMGRGGGIGMGGMGGGAGGPKPKPPTTPTAAANYASYYGGCSCGGY